VLTQLPYTDTNNQKMQMVFYRLESLVSEFASIEKLLVQPDIEKKSYYFEDILDNAEDILMGEVEIKKEIENIVIDVDFNLFSIAIKNLLDNAIKYSIDKDIKVTLKNSILSISNKGDMLGYPLESYFEPFFKGDDVKSNQSFGLGLYIVKHILDAHNFKLLYSYKNNQNIFEIKF
jgi:two-component system OmpR family sensor kinase